MRYSITYLILIVSITFLSACEKAIDLKLNNTTPQYVIEGVLTNEPGGCKVLISQTKKFTDDNVFNGVSGAQVSISNNGNTYIITPTAQGVYQNSTFSGTPGQSYLLSVNINGKDFTGACTMPQQVKLDSIYLVKDNFGNNADGTTRKYITVKYLDPAAVKNSYRFVQYIDGRKEKTVFVDNDEFTNGQVVNNQLRADNVNDDPARDIRSGNHVTIEMLNIDATVYKYWFSLAESAGGDGNNAAPANPVTNIQGGALGYFSAHNIQKKTLIAP
ncbi:DUF4249 domain-containing protein [Mucilaginibacter sp. UYCu711]|uniref:DUF4249 domain-containing protein n=1 Tax=Mucilaginibacter sp. UYCu711 TaxID=3156339 RepID=UPI003D1A57CF